MAKEYRDCRTMTVDQIHEEIRRLREEQGEIKPSRLGNRLKFPLGTDTGAVLSEGLQVDPAVARRSSWQLRQARIDELSYELSERKLDAAIESRRARRGR